MQFKYFIYTSGEEGRNGDTEWDIKFASLGFPAPDNDDEESSGLCEAYRKKIKSASFGNLSPSLKNHWDEENGYLLLPWNKSYCLAGVYAKFHDEQGRSNISLIMAAVPAEVMARVTPEYFLSRLCATKDLFKIACPQIAQGDQPVSGAARPQLLNVANANSDNVLDVSLEALKQERIDWENLDQAVLAVKGEIHAWGETPLPQRTKQNDEEAVITQTESTAPEETPAIPANSLLPHLDQHRAETQTVQPDDAVLSVKQNGGPLPTTQITPDSVPEVKTAPITTTQNIGPIKLNYFVLTSGEKDAQGDEDWGIKFVSEGFPLQSDQSDKPLALALDAEYKQCVRTFENGSLSFQKYWKPLSQSGYILLPWGQDYCLAGCYMGFTDNEERPNVSWIIAAVDDVIRKNMTPEQFFAALQSDNCIEEIARPRREKDKKNLSFEERPPYLNLLNAGTTPEYDASLQVMSGIDWTQSFIVVDGNCKELRKSMKPSERNTPVFEPWSMETSTSSSALNKFKLWALVAALVLFVVASGTVFTMYRSKVRLEGELAVAQQNLAIKEKEISKLHDMLESQAKVSFAQEQEISELKGKYEELQKKAEAQEEQIDVLQQQLDALMEKSLDGENSVESPESGKM
ncbi:MAG: hypothetical protein ACOYD9_05865 [Pyramidobacter sp.]|jgi:hypothetical protein